MTPDTDLTRILVCEDSATYARALANFLEYQASIKVVGVCSSGEEALRSLSRLAPDLVMMDLELPGIGGLRAIEQIMRVHPTPIVVLSAYTGRRSENAAAVLAAGALDALDKEQLRLLEPGRAAAVALRHRLKRLAKVQIRHQHDDPPVTAGIEPLLAPASAIGICSSTGGPRALETILARLPRDFALPILVSQHMSPGFTDGFARWLDHLVPLPVAVAGPGMSGPGVWIAPDDNHLILGPSLRLSLDAETVVGPHRPSGDVMLSSMARALGPRALGVVLTGMGRDGAKGVAAVVRAGGSVIAQDEATSVVFGMPQAAIAKGAQLVLPLSSIASALCQVTLEAAAR
jgi:two-component system chemotaxis response regulator CheB